MLGAGDARKKSACASADQATAFNSHGLLNISGKYAARERLVCIKVKLSLAWLCVCLRHGLTTARHPE